MSSSDEDPREYANQRLRDARAAWGQAMTAHKMAPPDAASASRLRALSMAAQAEREAGALADAVEAEGQEAAAEQLRRHAV